MTADEIRNTAKVSGINVSPKSGYITGPGEQVFFLAEIAAQLAELNARLDKVIAPFGSAHVVNTAPAK